MPGRSVPAAYFYDKQASLCECYHSLGWGATLQGAKILAEALLVSGVNCLVPHGFFYSTHAQKARCSALVLLPDVLQAVPQAFR